MHSHGVWAGGGDSHAFMPNEVDGICTQEDAGRHCTTKEILEMIPPAYMCEEEGVVEIFIGLHSGYFAR